MRLAAILFNPIAGRGRAPHLAAMVEQGLKARGFAVSKHATQCAGDGQRLARELPEDVQRVFVVGGDGTLREVACGILERPAPPALAHVPLGNANVIARELGIPLQAEAAVPLLLDGEVRTLDVLRVEGHIVLAMVGVGYDAETAEVMARARSGPLRHWYRWHGDSLYGTVGALLLCKPSLRRIQIEVDSEQLPGEFTGCILSNMRTYAKGWAPNPEADPTDGLLDYQGLRPGWLPVTALALVAAAQERTLPARFAVHGRGRKVTLRSAKAFAWQADGDAMGRTRELSIEVLPRALPLLAPRRNP